MNEQYFIDEELLDILHECGMVKTEKELAVEKKLEEEAQKEEAEKQEEGNKAEKVDMDALVLKEMQELNNALIAMNESMETFGKMLKAILLTLKDND